MHIALLLKIILFLISIMNFDFYIGILAIGSTDLTPIVIIIEFEAQIIE